MYYQLIIPFDFLGNGTITPKENCPHLRLGFSLRLGLEIGLGQFFLEAIVLKSIFFNFWVALAYSYNSE